MLIIIISNLKIDNSLQKHIIFYRVYFLSPRPIRLWRNLILYNMKKFLNIILVISLLATLLPVFGLVKAEGARKIVVFKDGVTDAERDTVLGKVVRIKRLHHALNADVVEGLSLSETLALKFNNKVARLDDDVVVEALGRTNATAAAQVVPWGVSRVKADFVWPSGNTGDVIKVAVVDTGISLTHPDLAANIKGSVNTISPGKSANDDNGHGSHVAGTIAAVNNSLGVVGVAPNVDLYAVKVLNRNGSGYLSDIIEGLDWSIANGMNVVNMSLGTSSDVQSFHDAVIRVHNAGIVQVVAAGNSGGLVGYPAAYPEVIAVSAVDANNVIASWSSRGPEVDVSAPGVSIYSTYKGTSYATLSGTSMASPHVAGVVALILSTPVGVADANGNGRWDPDEVQTKLQNTATDLGAAGYDNLYGWGLVNAVAAVAP